MGTDDEREALLRDLRMMLANLRLSSHEVATIDLAIEALRRQGQITEAVVEAAAITIFTSTDSEWAAEDWHSDWLTEETRNVWRKYARAALQAAEEARRG